MIEVAAPPEPGHGRMRRFFEPETNMVSGDQTPRAMTWLAVRPIEGQPPRGTEWKLRVDGQPEVMDPGLLYSVTHLMIRSGMFGRTPCFACGVRLYALYIPAHKTRDDARVLTLRMHACMHLTPQGSQSRRSRTGCRHGWRMPGTLPVASSWYVEYLGARSRAVSCLWRCLHITRFVFSLCTNHACDCILVRTVGKCTPI